MHTSFQLALPVSRSAIIIFIVNGWRNMSPQRNRVHLFWGWDVGLYSDIWKCRPLPVHAVERWQPKWSVCWVAERERLILNTLWQGEEVVRVLPAQSSDSFRRHKRQGGDGNNSYSFLPTSSFASSLSAERDSSHSSFKYFVIYLSFFSFFQLCA